MRHLHRAPRRRTRAVVPRPARRDRGMPDHDGRGDGGGRPPPPAPASLCRAGRRPVRVLHARHSPHGDGASRRPSEPDPAGGQGRARRKSLPLHRVYEDPRRRRARGPADGTSGGPHMTKSDFAVIGQPLPKVDAWAKVVGETKGADLARVKFGILPVSQDEEVLCTEKVRMVGDAIAAVAAVDEETAEQACRLIEVDYEPLPALMSIFDALAHPEVRIHEYGDGPNVHKSVALQFGDVDAALTSADLVREDVFFFEGSNHLPMEQHAAVAHWGSDGKL